MQRNAKPDEKQDSTQQIENRFRSGGIGESEIVYTHLYPNRWYLVNHNREYWRVLIN